MVTIALQAACANFCTDCCNHVGIYSRHLRHTLGAAKVVGIDNSKSMITLAQQAENIRTAGHRVEYVHGDAASVSQIAGGGFDLVLGAYLFNYAQTEEELEKFFQTVFVNLKPGGRLVAINDNMTDDPSLYHPVLDTWKYGYRKSVEGGVGRKEGAKILYECADARGNVFSFANYWLKVETYERVMRRVGFTSWKWIDVRVNEEGLARFGGDFWQNLLANRTMICLEACK